MTFDDDERAIRAALEQDHAAIASCKDEIESYLGQVCARLARNSDLRPRFVEARQKPANSVVRKLREKSLGAAELYTAAVGDLVGARVVVYNLSDVESFASEVLNDSACPLSDVTREDISYPSGYRALHLNGRLDRFGIEVQIRTAVQDAWAVTSRADVYRSDSDEPLIKALARAQGKILEGVDEVLQEIRDLSEKSRIEDADIQEVTGADEPPTPIVPQEGLSQDLFTAAKAELSNEDRFVLEGKISADRIMELREEIENARESSFLYALLDAVGRYERVHEYRSDSRFGNSIITWKGPFVEGSNWGRFHGNDFARGLEGFLEKQLANELSKNTDRSVTLESWKAVEAFIAESIQYIRRSGGTPDLVVFAGSIHDDCRLEIFQNSIWIPNPKIRGRAISDSSKLDNEVAGLPSFWIYEDVEPAIHVLDLEAVHYARTNPSPDNDEALSLKVREFEWEDAVDLLQRNPNVVDSLENGRELTREEAVVRLQLRVRLNLVEGGLIQYVGSPQQVHSALLRAAQA